VRHCLRLNWNNDIVVTDAPDPVGELALVLLSASAAQTPTVGSNVLSVSADHLMWRTSGD
jgi:hypothetical protein